ncbi:MAG: PhoU domain-containing protein [Nitrospirota bacterium]
MKNKILDSMVDMASMAEEMITLVREGYQRHTMQSLIDAEKIAKKLHKSENKALEILIKESSGEGNIAYLARSFIAIPGHLERIGDDIESIISCVKTKINEAILFSEKAANEHNLLFSKTSELMKSTEDIIITQNNVLINHVKKEVALFVRTADEFATEHEERLISGVCSPKSSSMYIDILDSLKEVVWHIGEIANKVSVL